MARTFDDITATVGNTPLVRLNRVSAGLKSTTVAKTEALNPLSSVKDRVGLSMIEAADAEGWIYDDTVIVEPASGFSLV